MRNDNEMVTNWNWRHAVKLAVAIAVILYLINGIYSVTSGQNEVGELMRLQANQEKDIKAFTQKTDKEAKAIQNGMADGAKSMDKKMDSFSKDMDDFAKEFSSSLDAAIKKIDEHEQQRVFDNFAETHYRYYDEELYEQERQKTLSQHEGVTLPTYKEFAELREKAIWCNWKSHNHTQETYYRNEIAKLKAEHNEAAIASVPKPDLWPEPVTSEIKDKVIRSAYMNVMLIIRQDGTCRYE